MRPLQAVREALLVLHKTLLDAERVAYERRHGRQAAGAFLHAVVHADAFGWLRPWTALIVRIDELLELPADTLEREDVDACLREARDLIRLPVAATHGEQGRYAELLQQSPDVVIAHGRLLRALSA